jgi:hypothetical protein
MKYSQTSKLQPLVAEKGRLERNVNETGGDDDVQ